MEKGADKSFRIYVILTGEQIIQLLTLAKNNNIVHFLIFLLAVTTGVRTTELSRLQWKDIDFENSFLTIHRSNHERYQIRLKPTILDQLKEFQKICTKREDSLFPRLTSSQIIILTSCYLKKININDEGFLIFRRTFKHYQASLHFNPELLRPFRTRPLNIQYYLDRRHQSDHY
jgi:integrase